MTRYSILDLCARIEGHETQYVKLREACKSFGDWESLLSASEQEGMSPLLYKHLVASKSECPKAVLRTLMIVARRHEHRTKIRIQALKEILELLAQNKLTPLLIKGAALCHTVYPEPRLRPMRDMDILLREDEAQKAQELIISLGFSGSSSARPDDHFHLPSLLKTVDGVPLCIEVHTGLYPDCPPYYPDVDFDTLLAEAMTFDVDGVAAKTFGHEDTLYYVYQHGFRMPLTYEPFKLINAADVISYIERYFHEIDWQALKDRYPALLKALPLFHYLSPFDRNIVSSDFLLPLQGGEKEVTRYTGWPKMRMKEQKAEGKNGFSVLKDTFMPPSWWLGNYYGAVSKSEQLWCVLYSHPRHIFWWVKLYASFLDQDEKHTSKGKSAFGGRVRSLVNKFLNP